MSWRSRCAASLVGISILAYASALPSRVMAEDAPPSSEFSRCVKASGGVTADLLDCNRQEYDRLDKRLNAAYSHLMEKSIDKQKAALRDSQRDWLKYRKNTCNLIYTFGDGGTLDSISASSCEVDTLESRVKFLEDLSGE